MISSPSVEFWGSYAADPLFRIVTIRPAIYYMAGHNELFVYNFFYLHYTFTYKISRFSITKTSFPTIRID